jgi:hypothetical protein
MKNDFRGLENLIKIIAQECSSAQESDCPFSVFFYLTALFCLCFFLIVQQAHDIIVCKKYVR